MDFYYMAKTSICTTLCPYKRSMADEHAFGLPRTYLISKNKEDPLLSYFNITRLLINIVIILIDYDF